MKKSFVKIVLTSVALCAATPSWASVKVGLIDMRAVMETSGQSEKVRKALEAEFGEKHKALQEKVKLLQRDGANLEKERPVLSKKALEKKQAALQKRSLEISGEDKSLQQAAYQKHQALMAEVINTVKTAAANVAVYERLDLVLQKGEVVYTAKSIDITDKVKQEVQKKS